MLVLKPVENEVEDFAFDESLLPSFAVYRLAVLGVFGAVVMEMSMS
jgi:hypothetical protein